MKLSIGRFQIGRAGCSEHEIAKLESNFGVRLPSPYRKFLSRFGRDRDASSVLRGSDYSVPVLFELRAWAEELLQENGSPFALHPQDFVVLMHQGYQFFYFRADGASDDPPVFYYFEGRTQPEQKFSTVSDWLRECGVFVALPCAAANGGGPSRLQSARLVAAVAELGSLGRFTRIRAVAQLWIVRR